MRHAHFGLSAFQDSVVGEFKAFFSAWLDESLLRECERENERDVSLDPLSVDFHAAAESEVEIHNHGEKGDMSDSNPDPKLWNASLG